MKRWISTVAALLLALHIPTTYAQKGKNMQTIYLAGGCFWGIEHLYSLVHGVHNAQSGYANGRTQNPTYQEVKQGDTGHRETVRVDFDADAVPLNDLLSLYFRVVDVGVKDQQGHDVGSQYQAGIYWTDESQKRAVLSYVEQEKKRHSRFLVELAPLTSFTPAEDYHQDYLDKNPSGYCHVSLSAFQYAKELHKKQTQAPVYREIAADEALKMKQNDRQVMLVDVRTPGEYREGHIPDAVNLPLDMLADIHEEAIPSKQETLIVYCRSGARSRTAAGLLVSLGYERVLDLGGIIDWPYDIERE